MRDEDARRERAVLESLASHRLNLAELTERVNREWFGKPLSQSQIRTVLKRLQANADVVIDENMWEAT